MDTLRVFPAGADLRFSEIYVSLRRKATPIQHKPRPSSRPNRKDFPINRRSRRLPQGKREDRHDAEDNPRPDQPAASGGLTMSYDAPFAGIKVIDLSQGIA